MISQRISNVITHLPEPCCLFTSTVDLAYLTGVSLEGFWLLLTPRGGVIFTATMLAEQLRQEVPDIPVMAADDVFKLLIDYCRKNRIATIGIDASRLTYGFARRLEGHLQLKDISAFLPGLRQIKEAGEIEKIRTACRITVETWETVKKFVRPGVTEEAIMFKIEELFAKKHVRPAFTSIVAFGPNTANPHHLSGPRRLEENDTVLMDIGCVYQGYCSDLTRTYFFGKISNLKRKIYALVQKAHDQAIRELRGGKAANTIDGVARGIIAEAGYGDRFIHTTGHGVGVEIHESPRVSKKDKTILKPGMVITIEPGVYLDGQFGVRIEDTLLVTEKGYEVLTQ